MPDAVRGSSHLLFLGVSGGRSVGRHSGASEQLTAVAEEMANQISAFHAEILIGSRITSAPSRSSLVSARFASRTRATASALRISARQLFHERDIPLGHLLKDSSELDVHDLVPPTSMVPRQWRTQLAGNIDPRNRLTEVRRSPRQQTLAEGFFEQHRH